MNREIVDRIVGATLYEGYILYPYRSTSVKNQVRWTFGGIHPRAFSEASSGSEPWLSQVECLLEGDDDATVEVHVRFLQPVSRTVAALDVPASALGDAEVAALRSVDSLRAGGVTHRGWQEAIERDIDAGTLRCGDLADRPLTMPLRVAAGREVEALTEADAVVGALLRDSRPLEGEIEISAERVQPGVVRVRVAVRNLTPLEEGAMPDREEAMLHSLVSTHAILGVEGGRWLSLADPPAHALAAADTCRQIGMWPVLVGEPGSGDTILASPIILEDHPEVAPESPGDLFDATEIDEILSLRILTLTEEEKDEMRATDERSRALLERTEALTADQMMRMHGTIREPRVPREVNR